MEESIVTGTRAEVLEAARAFARAIGESSQFREYEQAAGSMRDDTAARALLEEYQEARQAIQIFQGWSGGSSARTVQFRELEEKVLRHPKLRKYLEAQEELVLAFQKLNISLRDELGFDFARLARPAGGCCC